MKKQAVLFLIFLSATFVQAQAQVDRPKLVVGIIVDQMREEYLYRFYDHYSDNGFKRLMNEGFEVKNAHYNYSPTKTAPGHASVYTGTTPRVHGIIANDWYDRGKKENIYCAYDESVQGLGGDDKAGKMSPKKLKVTTITDELGMFFQYQSKVIGVSIKDRGAIFPAGHAPSGAYWYDKKTGNFITSTYYKNELPKWVSKFNKVGWVKKYHSEKWNTLFPIENYSESAADDRSFEKIIFGSKSSTFPYKFSNVNLEDFKKNITVTPWGNTILLEFAKEAIVSEQMGVDKVPDFLALSFSSTDYAGHAFGPQSKEIQDMYIRLDRDLATLFSFLDEQVGAGEWMVYLTADHAVADIPGTLREKQFTVNYFNHSENKDQLNIFLEEKFNQKELVENVSNDQVFLNTDLIEQKNLNLDLLKSEVIKFYKKQPGIQTVYDAEMISDYSGWNADITMLSAGYNQQRSGDIMYTLESGWLGTWFEKYGTSHGTHYTYDTHVPMLFYGWGIDHDKTYQYHAITDLAPTLSMLLNIKIPSGATGKPIVELLD